MKYKGYIENVFIQVFPNYKTARDWKNKINSENVFAATLRRWHPCYNESQFGVEIHGDYYSYRCDLERGHAEWHKYTEETFVILWQN